MLRISPPERSADDSFLSQSVAEAYEEEEKRSYSNRKEESWTAKVRHVQF